MNAMRTDRRRGAILLTNGLLTSCAVALGGCTTQPGAVQDRPMTDPVTLRGEAIAPTPPPVFAQIPAGSELTVRLVDTAYRDEASGVIGQYRGYALKWPIGFDLKYDRARIRAARMYSLEASVRADGRLMYEHAAYLPLCSEGGESVRIPMRKAPE